MLQSLEHSWWMSSVTKEALAIFTSALLILLQSLKNSWIPFQSISSDICSCACETRVDQHRTDSLGWAHSSKHPALYRVVSSVHTPFSGSKDQHTHNRLQIVLLQQPLTLYDRLSFQLIIEWASNSNIHYVNRHSRQLDISHTNNWLCLQITHYAYRLHTK